MEPRISLITLGVSDLARSREFYEKGLGWSVSPASSDDVVFFQTKGAVLGLFPRHELAKDAGIDEAGNGFRSITLAHNVRDKGEVTEILKMAERAGATITKPAQDVFWGGHSGYFTDPDGHLWEVAWNPHFALDENGQVQLP